MRFKEDVQIDVLKMFGFRMVEYNEQTGFKRYNKHYGSILVTVCNNRLEKRIHLTLLENGQEVFEGKRMIASIHQINKDLCQMASQGLLALEEVSSSNMEDDDGERIVEVNDWNAQIAFHNPFAFMNNPKNEL